MTFLKFYGGKQPDAGVKFVIKYDNETEQTTIVDYKPNITLYYADGTIDEYPDATEMTWDLIKGKTKYSDVNTTLLKAELNDNVTYVKDYAFYKCSSLKTILLGNNVIEIGSSAFSGCTSLVDINTLGHITKLSDGVFAGCLSLTNIVIPDSVTIITNSAFSACTSLTNITIPDSVTTISNWAFSGCTSLTTLTLSNINDLLNGAFSGCTSLTSINISGNGKGTIYGAPFSECNNLTDVIIGEGIITIDGGAFGSCGSIEVVSLPDSITTITSAVFSVNLNLKKVIYKGNEYYSKPLLLKVLQNNNVTVTDASFTNTGLLDGIYMTCYNHDPGTYAICYGDEPNVIVNGVDVTNKLVKDGDYWYYTFTEGENVVQVKETLISISAYSKQKTLFNAYYKVIMGEGIDQIAGVSMGETYIGTFSFQNCTKLEEVILPDTVTQIGTSAFQGCTNLKYIKLSNNLNTIGIDAFNGCASLETITLPDNITNINDYAFYGSINLTSVTYKNQTYSIKAHLINDLHKNNVKLGCTTPSIDKSFNKTGLIDTYMTCYNNAPGTYAVCYGNDPWMMVNGENVTEQLVQDGEYWYYTFVEGENVIQVKEELVQRCLDYDYSKKTTLSKVLFNAYYKVEVAEGLTSIDGTAINGTYVGTYSFDNCTKLQEVILPDSIQTIGQGAFARCTNLKQINLSNNMSRLYDYTFQQCTSLWTITIPNNITSFGIGVFMQCTSITEIVLPNKLAKINIDTFRSCKNLTTVTIPVSVTTISERAFSDCSSLSTINYGGTKAQWNAINKAYNNMAYTTRWNYNVPSTCIVRCIDGDVNI